ncbi:phage tail assembly chaperone [Zooshikella sp. RANM57]|uniref:phage tail assembly chaperone n=1 Tax=Zooshikella sp. RANM57 TaxID=3425863 RepID=UPI003D6E392C
MASMQSFFTRQKANEGIKLPLSLPDGTPTDEYLMIRGIDSDHYQTAINEAKRAIFAKSSKDTSDYDPAEAELDVLVSLVAGWSFEEELTPENIKNFLKEAPQIAKQIDKLAGDRALFFGKKQSS